MIGLIIAEKEETLNLIKTIKAKTIEFNGVRYYVGSVDNKQALVCFSGMGKANAAATAMNMIDNFSVDKIFNIGLCGCTRPNVVPGSILIVDKVEYSDVDLTALDYPLNQIPYEPSFYEIQKKYLNFLKQLIPDSIIGSVATSDSFITINNVESFPSLANKDIVGLDMEATAIAQICNKTKTEFFCVKVISDNLTFDDSSKKQYRTSFKELGKKIEKICIDVIKNFDSEDKNV